MATRQHRSPPGRVLLLETREPNSGSNMARWAAKNGERAVLVSGTPVEEGPLAAHINTAAFLNPKRIANAINTDDPAELRELTFGARRKVAERAKALFDLHRPALVHIEVDRHPESSELLPKAGRIAAVQLGGLLLAAREAGVPLIQTSGRMWTDIVPRIYFNANDGLHDPSARYAITAVDAAQLGGRVQLVYSTGLAEFCGNREVIEANAHFRNLVGQFGLPWVDAHEGALYLPNDKEIVALIPTASGRPTKLLAQADGTEEGWKAFVGRLGDAMKQWTEDCYHEAWNAPSRRAREVEGQLNLAYNAHVPNILAPQGAEYRSEL